MKSNKNYWYFRTHPDIPDSSSWAPRINERLKVIRKSWMLTQEQFANLLGLSVTAYNLIETGKRKVNNQIVRLAYFQFHANLSYLLYNEERDCPIEDWSLEDFGDLLSHILSLNPEAREHAISLVQDVEILLADMRSLQTESKILK